MLGEMATEDGPHVTEMELAVGQTSATQMPATMFLKAVVLLAAKKAFV